MSSWLKNKMIGLMMAMHKTESNIQAGRATDDLEVGEGKFQSHKQGMLSHSLINGELTEEVKELRWRIYKVLEHTDSVKTEIIGYDEDDMPIVKTVKRNAPSTEGFKGDPSDDLKVLLVVNNKPLGTGLNEADLTSDDNLNVDDYLIKYKGKKSIFIKREGLQQFEIEKYTSKLVVKEFEDDIVLLEFYVSKYPDTDDRRSRLFISEVEKVMKGKRFSSVTDIDEVYFISEKTLGAENNLEFEFVIDSFDKITQYDGHYLIKFLATKVVYGDNIFEKYKMKDLEERYENKAKK